MGLRCVEVVMTKLHAGSKFGAEVVVLRVVQEPSDVVVSCGLSV